MGPFHQFAVAIASTGSATRRRSTGAKLCTSKRTDTHRALEQALKRKEFLHVLLHLLPPSADDQSENQLRLFAAIIDLQHDINNASPTPHIKAKQRKIASTFLHSGSRFEVECVSVSLWNLDGETCERIAVILAAELGKINEIVAALIMQTKQHLISIDLTDGFDENDAIVAQMDTKKLVVLQSIIASSEQRRQFIMQTIGSQRDIGLKVRFVAAVNQYLATITDKQERRRLGQQIALIFLTPSGMFHVQLPSMLHHHILQGEYDVLEQARAFVLNELIVEKEVICALHSITNESSSHGSFCSTSESKGDM